MWVAHNYKTQPGAGGGMSRIGFEHAHCKVDIVKLVYELLKFCCNSEIHKW